MDLISKELKPFFKLSVAFHIGIFLFFGVKILLFPDLTDLDQDGTIKVDMVALPNLEDNKKIVESDIKESPQPDAEQEQKQVEKPIPKPKEVVKNKPEKKPPPIDTKEDETSAFQKLQELQALQKLSQKSKEPVATAESAPEVESLIKGNRLAEGDSITGVNRIQYTNYKKILHDAVKNKWNLPSWIQDGQLFAEAMIKISETGHITEKVLTTSSGNAMYDKYVLQAITEASPFPAPPDKFVNIVGIKGVVLRFP